MSVTAASFLANAVLICLLLAGYFYHEDAMDSLAAADKTACENAQKKLQKKDTSSCIDSKIPTKEANQYANNQDSNALKSCISKLQQCSSSAAPGRVVYITRSAGKSGGADQQCGSGGGNGLAVAGFQAYSYECREDRTALNACKIWKDGVKANYQKYLNEQLGR